MEKERIILDVDTGHDDAVAIALAAGLKDRIQLEGLVATYGNTSRKNALENTLNMAEALGIEAPVFHGAFSPLCREWLDQKGIIHGETGFNGPVFPPRTKKECQGNGILWALDKVISNPGQITYVSVGPWTDLALMIKADERFVRSLKGIVLMGGSVKAGGNVTPYAEFNVFSDPEAADIVLQCGAPITMMGLDVTLQVRLTEEILHTVEAMDNHYKEIFLASMKFYGERLRAAHDMMPAMHDPCCIAYLADPSIFEFEERPIRVITKDPLAYGMTVSGAKTPECRMKYGVKADADKFWALFMKAVRNLP